MPGLSQHVPAALFLEAQLFSDLQGCSTDCSPFPEPPAAASSRRGSAHITKSSHSAPAAAAAAEQHATVRHHHCRCWGAKGPWKTQITRATWQLQLRSNCRPKALLEQRTTPANCYGHAGSRTAWARFCNEGRRTAWQQPPAAPVMLVRAPAAAWTAMRVACLSPSGLCKACTQAHVRQQLSFSSAWQTRHSTNSGAQAPESCSRPLAGTPSRPLAHFPHCA